MSPRKVYASGFSGAADDVYEALLKAHDGLTEAESHALNARLVLLLANRVGDPAELLDIIATARSYSEG